MEEESGKGRNRVEVFKEKEGYRRERSASVNVVLDKWLKRKREEDEEGMKDNEEEGGKCSKKVQGTVKGKEGVEEKEESKEGGENEMEVGRGM